MLTMTPPETRESEDIQVDDIRIDESDDRGVILHMSRRLEATRKRRQAKRLGTKITETDCKGFNYIQLIVGMIIFVALSRIVGPPAFRMITRARSTALSANIQTAAETVRNVIAIEPALVTNVTIDPATKASAEPDGGLLAQLTADAPFQWEDDWDLTATDAANIIRVQLIDNDTAPIAPTAGATGLPPSVNWLLTDWDAVRIHARNQDGAWACALIVLKPNTNGIPTSASNKPADAAAEALADAQLRGIWFDSGPSYEAADQAHHCSPVVTAATPAAVEAPLPTDSNTWTISAGTGTPANPAAELTRSP